MDHGSCQPIRPQSQTRNYAVLLGFRVLFVIDFNVFILQTNISDINSSDMRIKLFDVPSARCTQGSSGHCTRKIGENGPRLTFSWYDEPKIHLNEKILTVPNQQETRNIARISSSSGMSLSTPSLNTKMGLTVSERQAKQAGLGYKAQQPHIKNS